MAPTDTSIIEIIEKMVRDGEPEEKIIKTLTELGVNPENAKRLLLIGQADTFALLKREIKKVVEQELDKEKPTLKKFIEEEAMQAAYQSRQELTKAVITDLKEYEKDITGHGKIFEEQVSDNIRRSTDLNEKVKTKLNELGETVRQIQTDMDEVRIKGVGGRNKLIGNALWTLGILFGIGDLYLFVSTIGKIPSIDTIMLMVFVTIITVTVLFVATIA